ncbi:MAG: type II toxin-antitoxin system HicB family antitoxin [Thermoguttaceae bacterium]
MNDYKGYSAKVVLDEEQGVFHGQVIGTTDIITFEGGTPEELVNAFHDSVDDYLAFCEQRGEKADKPYSGRFVLRVTPELHRGIAIAAKRANVSMNDWITAALEEALEKPVSPRTPQVPQHWEQACLPSLLWLLSQHGQEALKSTLKAAFEESQASKPSGAASRRF